MSKNAPRLPTQLSLSVFTEFKASHSLTGYEIPHFHLWKLALEFYSALPLPSDRLIDLIELQKLVHQITAPLEGQHLNSVLPALSPTSENLAQWVWAQFVRAQPQAPLYSVKVTLCDGAGSPTGSAKVFAPSQND